MNGHDKDYQFVQLNRTFHPLPKNHWEDDNADLSRSYRGGPELTWPDLLKRFRVIVLSEAGSGKTEEIRQIALRLLREQKAAFFLRLEHISEDFEVAFEVGTFEEFTKWLASNDEAWLLLDSVDEARLRNPADFERAIRKLASRIRAAKDRAHILVTGRSSAWRPKTDLKLCKQQLPFVPSTTVVGSSDEDERDRLSEQTISINQHDEQDDNSSFTIVALDDLSNDQIRAFACARGIEDTNAFLDAIERADARSFTSRPQDLEEIVEFWRDQGRVGSCLELMRNSIDRRLRERNQDIADARPLAAQRAREGVRLIAAATTLAQEPTISVPDGSRDDKGISLLSVLPDWDDKEHASLLSRPIFDEAIYGTVRFHHRSVREYLAAEWLADLLKRSTSRRAIESLLFRNQYGVDVVVPTMRPVLPWLAIMDDRIGERLRLIAPEVIFEGGDPSALPLETRRVVLGEVCEQLASGASGRSALDYTAVQRFAKNDLTTDIRVLLAKYSGNDDLRGFLLRMVWLGQLVELLPEAKEIALSPTVSVYTRLSAIRAVKAVGKKHDHQEICNSIVAETPPLNRILLNELIKDLEPSIETIGWLLTALESIEPKERFSFDELTSSVAGFVSSAAIQLLPRLLAGLNNLLERPPIVERRHCEISQKNIWLMKAAATGVERLIHAKSPEALTDIPLGILHKIGAARGWHDHEVDDIKIEFGTLVPAWPELNRAALWYSVQRARSALDGAPENRVTNFWQASVFGAFWNFVPDDFDYLESVIETYPEQDDKLVALSLALQQYVKSDRPRSWRERLKKIVQGNAELEACLSDFFNPPPSEFSRQESAWKKRVRAQEKRTKENFEKSKAYILGHIDELRNPLLPQPSDISQTQWYLHERLRENGSSTRWSEGRWRELIPEYGNDVARAYRDGVVAYWRKYIPQLRSEGAASNSVPISVIFGLTGLDIEATETTDWPNSLMDNEVVLACRYTAHELNGFPSWFPKLFEAWPVPVSAFLLQEIDYELSAESPESESHYILSDVTWSGQWAWDRIAQDIFQLLEKREIKNPANLGKLLAIVQGSITVSDTDIARLAERNARSAATVDQAAIWFAVWVGAEPACAIPALASHLESLSCFKEKTTFAMKFATRLLPGRRSEGTGVRPVFRTPTHLKNLYLLMHTYIRRSDDIDRVGGGVYSPVLRDDAQDARNALFEQLNKIPGKEAYVAVDEISKAHPDEAARPWFIFHAKAKAEQDADMSPWSPAQVREFHERLDRTPANHRELADLALLRLLDLKDDLENGDSSVARLLINVESEPVMRNYMGHELREKAFGRYTIPQEEELADAKRPDLRFHGVGFDAPVPVELKLADGWSGPDLFERLENQLIGDYLRDTRSTHGIFVLAYKGKKQGWDIPGSANRVNFDGLTEALRGHWQSIAEKYPKVEDISVIGIDLTKRLS